ncbi:hypothetical protein PFISCL1PPCAC_17018, partial [Pristionchus fissidentatus]
RYQANFDVVNAMHATGQRFEGWSSAFELLNAAFISKVTHHDVLSTYSCPAGIELRDEKMDGWIDRARQANPDGNIGLGYDAQYDSPGHCATIGKVDGVEVKTGLCLDIQILERKETG